MSLNADCLAQLGLRQFPFDTEPSEHFLYADPLQDGALDIAQLALAESDSIVIIAGANGSGRSTQLMRLLGMLPPHYELIAFRARPNTSFDVLDLTIRHHLRQTLQVDPSSSLATLLATRIQAGTTQVIAIDDAHALDAAVIEHLLQIRRLLIDRIGSAPRFVFVGDSRLAQMSLPALAGYDEERVVRLHLRAFNREQTRVYLRFRLVAAGHPDPDALLDADSVETLHLRSNGLPKYLNPLANEWLQERCQSAQADQPSVQQLRTEALEAIQQASRQVMAANPELQAVLNDEHMQNTPPPPEATPQDETTSYLKNTIPINAAQIPLWHCRGFIPSLATVVIIAIIAPLFCQLSRPKPVVADCAQPKPVAATPPAEVATNAPQTEQLAQQETASQLAQAEPTDARDDPETTSSATPETTPPATEAAVGANAIANERAQSLQPSSAKTPPPLTLSAIKAPQQPAPAPVQETIMITTDPLGNLVYDYPMMAAVMTFINDPDSDAPLAIPFAETPIFTDPDLELTAPENSATSANSASTLNDESEPAISTTATADSDPNAPIPPARSTPAPLNLDAEDNRSLDETESEPAFTQSTTPTDTAEQVPAPPESSPLIDREWVTSRPAGHFTIQLVATDTRDDAEAYIARFNFDYPIHFVSTATRTRTYMVALLGDFTSLAAARAAAQQLPTDVLTQGHWIRSFRSVQNSLR
jgi:DamX protein